MNVSNITVIFIQLSAEIEDSGPSKSVYLQQKARREVGLDGALWWQRGSAPEEREKNTKHGTPVGSKSVIWPATIAIFAAKLVFYTGQRMWCNFGTQ